MEIAVYVLISVVFSCLGAFFWSIWRDRQSKIDEILSKSRKIDEILSRFLDIERRFVSVGNDMANITNSGDRERRDSASFRTEMTDFMNISAKAIKDLRDEVSEIRCLLFGSQDVESLPPVSVENIEASYEYDVKSLMEQGFDRSYAERVAAEAVLDKLAKAGVSESLGMVNDFVGED